MKRLHIIGIVMIALAIMTIIVTVGDTSSYVSFQEAGKNPEKEYHVVGVLTDKASIHYDPIADPNYFTFDMTDKNGRTCKVVYLDAKPQDFERSEQVVVVGKMEDDEFHASKILMKCPSKYQDNKIKVKEVKDV